MQISARNKLPGKVTKLTLGPVNAEVIIEIAGGAQVVSVITRASAKALGLKKGMEVRAVIKSSDVMVGVCCGHGDCDCGT
jgi:molybdopterin-binding protein